MTDDAMCLHCRRRIFVLPFFGVWVHRDSQSVWCALTWNTKAVPA